MLTIQSLRNQFAINTRLIRRGMASVSQNQPFGIALVQLGGVTASKESNLNHARDMVRKAAEGNGTIKPKLVVLPVSLYHYQLLCADVFDH